MGHIQVLPHDPVPEMRQRIRSLDRDFDFDPDIDLDLVPGQVVVSPP
ncbi:MAG: hypothetical protein H6Q05_2069 [Acidobacteria bacterium]|jgi:hypothetical protein|nr:hypothetical protein [Acidobacteriota bacterium]